MAEQEDNNSQAEKDQLQPLSDRELIFEYKGGIYNRPLGKGISLKDGEYGARGLYLDEVIPEGDFEIAILRTVFIEKAQQISGFSSSL